MWTDQNSERLLSDLDKAEGQNYVVRKSDESRRELRTLQRRGLVTNFPLSREREVTLTTHPGTADAGIWPLCGRDNELEALSTARLHRSMWLFANQLFNQYTARTLRSLIANDHSKRLD